MGRRGGHISYRSVHLLWSSKKKRRTSYKIKQRLKKEKKIKKSVHKIQQEEGRKKGVTLPPPLFSALKPSLISAHPWQSWLLGGPLQTGRLGARLVVDGGGDDGGVWLERLGAARQAVGWVVMMPNTG